MLIQILNYSDIHLETVRGLNHEWLDKYGLHEPMDDVYLDNPKEMIIDKGGYIYLAEAEGKLVGTIAMLPIDDGIMEIDNFAVTETAQGQGIGRLLLSHCIEAARSMGYKKMVLESNSELKRALALYKKFGFKLIRNSSKKYAEADLAAELDL